MISYSDNANQETSLVNEIYKTVIALLRSHFEFQLLATRLFTIRHNIISCTVSTA